MYRVVQRAQCSSCVLIASIGLVCCLPPPRDVPILTSASSHLDDQTRTADSTNDGIVDVSARSPALSLGFAGCGDAALSQAAWVDPVRMRTDAHLRAGHFNNPCPVREEAVRR